MGFHFFESAWRTVSPEKMSSSSLSAKRKQLVTDSDDDETIPSSSLNLNKRSRRFIDDEADDSGNDGVDSESAGEEDTGSLKNFINDDDESEMEEDGSGSVEVVDGKEKAEDQDGTQKMVRIKIPPTDNTKEFQGSPVYATSSSRHLNEFLKLACRVAGKTRGSTILTTLNRKGVTFFAYSGGSLVAFVCCSISNYQWRGQSHHQIQEMVLSDQLLKPFSQSYTNFTLSTFDHDDGSGLLVVTEDVKDGIKTEWRINSLDENPDDDSLCNDWEYTLHINMSADKLKRAVAPMKDSTEIICLQFFPSTVRVCSDDQSIKTTISQFTISSHSGADERQPLFTTKVKREDMAIVTSLNGVDVVTISCNTEVPQPLEFKYVVNDGDDDGENFLCIYVASVIT